MSNYGELLESSDEINNVNVYNLFVAYYENPSMVKIKDLQGTHCLYGCRIKTLLAKDRRYLLATVPKNKAPSQPQVNLDALEWSAFEARSLDVDLQVPLHSYKPKHLDMSINVITKNPDQFIYACNDMTLTVTLFFGKNQFRPYNDKGTLGLALETFNTVVSL